MEIVKRKLKDFFKINNSYKIAKYTFLAVLIIGILAYHKVFYCIVANPDGLQEGYKIYHNANWASSGCGRWLIRYYNLLHFNRVIPGLVTIECILFNYLTSVVVIKVLKIDKISNAIISSLFLLVTPTCISQLSYTSVASVYSFSMFLSSLYVYFNIKNNKYGYIIGTLCLAICLGGYQPYIGFASCLMVMYIIKTIIDRQFHYKNVLRYLSSGVFGVILYYLIYKIDLLIYHLTSEYRMNEFSIIDTISSIPNRMIQMYKDYFNLFLDGILYRNYLYIVLFIIGFIVLIYAFIKISNKVVFIVLVLLIPIASNVIGIIIPFYEIKIIMIQQSFLIVPFLLSISEKRLNILLMIISCLISATYIYSANMTYKSYDSSYRKINDEMTKVMEEVRKLDDYIENETKIIIGGFVSYDKDDSYKNSIDIPENVAFWMDIDGAINGRYAYFTNMLKVNPQEINIDEYYYIIGLEDYYLMPCWPNNGSVKMIDGYVIVKFSDNPPIS